MQIGVALYEMVFSGSRKGERTHDTLLPEGTIATTIRLLNYRGSGLNFARLPRILSIMQDGGRHKTAHPQGWRQSEAGNGFSLRSPAQITVV